MTHISRQENYKILLLEGIHSGAYQLLKDEGFKVETLDHALTGDDLVEAAKSFHAVGIRSKTQLTQPLLERLPQLQLVGCFCIGTNQVNLEYTNLKGIPVFNAPYSNTRSVAELVIAEMIALARHLGDINSKAHQGIWQKSAKGRYEIRGKTLGIVGYGHIGSQVSVLAEAMGMKVQYFDIVKKLPLGNAFSVGTLKELMATSDYVTLHVPETEQTREMISAKEFKLMKKGSYLINASRGSVVVIPDLRWALKEGILAGAAIDVFPLEPKSNKDEFATELQGLENVILTPHVGGSTEEAQAAIGLEVAESVTKFLRSGFSAGAVNFPNLEVPLHHDGIRLVNVHKNVPGVMREINSIVSEVGANIRSQYLSTDANIGYMVMDLEEGSVEEAATKIDSLETSIKTRVL